MRTSFKAITAVFVLGDILLVSVNNPEMLDRLR
jgi:hypothetical protein